MNTQNVNVKIATPKPLKRCDEKPKSSLTAVQFRELCNHVIKAGQFVSLFGVCWKELGKYEEISDPSDHPEGMTLYLADGWPAAVYEFDIGYTIISGLLNDGDTK